MSIGIPGIAKVAVGVETAFGDSASTFYDAHWYGFERVNVKRNLIETDDLVRDNVGPAAGVAGLYDMVEVPLKCWGQSGVTAITGDPGTGYATDVYGILRNSIPGCAVAAGYTGSWGFAGTITASVVSDQTELVLTGEGSHATRYPKGAVVIMKAGTGYFFGAIESVTVTLVTNLTLRLDREIDFNSETVTQIYGCWVNKLVPLANADTLSTDGNVATLALQQKDLNDLVDTFVGGVCKTYALYADAGDEPRLNEEFTLITDSGTHGGVETTPSAAPTAKPIVAHNWEVYVNETKISNVASVRLDIEGEIQPIPDLSGTNGRSGWIYTGIKPKITITALNDDTTLSSLLTGAFAARTPVSVTVVCSPNATPTPGDYIAFYAPACVIADPYNVADSDTQTITVEFTPLYDSATAQSLTLSVG